MKRSANPSAMCRISSGLSVFLLIVLALSLFPTAGAAQSGAKIKKLDFQGNDAFSDSQLRPLLKSSGAAGISGIFGDDDTWLYDEDQLKAGLGKVVRFYQQEGFLRASISAGGEGSPGCPG